MTAATRTTIRRKYLILWAEVLWLALALRSPLRAGFTEPTTWWIVPNGHTKLQNILPRKRVTMSRPTAHQNPEMSRQPDRREEIQTRGVQLKKPRHGLVEPQIHVIGKNKGVF